VAIHNAFLRAMYVYPRHRVNELLKYVYQPDRAIQEEAVSAVALALYVLFRSYFESLQGRTSDDFSGRSYPSANTRFRIVSGLIQSVVAEERRTAGWLYGALDQRRAWELIQAGVGSGDTINVVLGGQPSGIDLLNNDPVSDEVQNEILRHWADLRPQLAPLVRAGTLAPVADLSGSPVCRTWNRTASGYSVNSWAVRFGLGDR